MMQTQQSLGIFTTDANLVVRSWDRWLAGVTGLSTNMIRGINLIELFPDIETRGLYEYFRQVLQDGIVVTLLPSEHHYLLPCAPQTVSERFTQMQQRVTITPLREKDRIIGTIVTIEDLTAYLDREQDLEDLVNQLNSPHENTRLNAARLLANKENVFQQTEQPLVDVLKDDSWRVRKVAMDGLTRRGGPEAITLLVQTLRDKHQELSILNSAIKILTQMKGDIVTPLVELLKSDDFDLRGYAVLVLGEQSDRRAIPALIEALNDPDINVRYHAIEALGKLGATEAIEALANIAHTEDFFLAFPALDALKSIGDSNITPYLTPLLSNDLLCDPVVEILGKLGDDSAVVPLVTLLCTQGTPVNLIVQALTALYHRYQELYNEGDKVAFLVQHNLTPVGIQSLLEALTYTQGDELRALATVIGWLEGTVAEQALIQMLGKPTVQKEVVQTLIRYGERIGELLMEQLNADDVEVCRAAIFALGQIGDKNAVPALLPFLTQENTDLVVHAAEALAKICDPRAFETLIDLLGHPLSTVRQAAVAALSSLNHPDMATRANGLLNHSDVYIRESAVRIVGYIGYAESLELLLTCCHDPNENVRVAAVESLPYFENPRILTLLVTILATDTAKVRAAAARAMAMVDDVAVLPHLHGALQDQDVWVRYFAARTLGQVGESYSVDVLARAAKVEEANPVRIAVVEALGQIGHVKAVPTLTALSKVEETEIAQAAMSALGKIEHSAALPPLLAALRASHPQRRLDAIHALSHHKEAETVQALQEQISIEENFSVIQAAFETLGYIGTAEAIAALISLAVAPYRRELGIEVLSQLSEQKIPLIAEGLHHPHLRARSVTVEALARMRHPFATQCLLIALTDKEILVRLSAVKAFEQLNYRGANQVLSTLANQDANPAVRRAAQRVLKRQMAEYSEPT